MTEPVLLADEQPDPELKRDALGLVSALIIGLNSTAPAYSLAAVVGLLAVEVGVQLPAILLICFVPMLLVASAYYFLNRADPDPGTTFAWATRALGPTTGWLAGWSIVTAGVIVIGLLANTAATYTYLFFGLDSAAESKEAVIALAVAYTLFATWQCVRGIEVSAHTQVVLIIAQLAMLALFAIVALVKVFGGDGVEGSVEPAAAWFSPLEIDSWDALVAGLLIGIFVYWGWDSAVTVNEESHDSAEGPGKAALFSTVILLGIYLLLGTACVAWLGAEALSEFEDETAFNAIASDVFASPLDKLVLLAVLTSALAATQTTVLPSSRTALSMGRHRAAPHNFAHVHPSYLTPDFATWVVGGVAIVFYVIFNYLSEAFYESALAALGLLICINYGLNALSCCVYYRNRLLASARNFVLMGVAPFLGFLVFAGVLVKSIVDFLESGVEDTTYWFGIQSPLVVTIGLFVVAAILIAVWRSSHRRPFFDRRLETAELELPAAAAVEAQAPR